MSDDNNKQPPVRLEVPYFMHEPQQHLRSIKWCDGHWADLMFALKDRGMANMIAPNPEELNAKFVRGEADPCWEACNLVNVGALEIFGPNKVCEENNGCPVCAFANITQHAADLMAMKFLEAH